MRVEKLTSNYEYKYFISYKWYTGRMEGFGNSFITTTIPLDSEEAIKKVQKAVEDNLGENALTGMIKPKVIILNFQLLNKTTRNDNSDTEDVRISDTTKC